MVDKRLPLQERRAIAAEFLEACECCLDEFFSRKVRKFFRCVDDLFLEPVRNWLFAIFSKALSLTTHIENGFAHYRAYLNSCTRAPMASSAAAIHVLKEALRIHGRWLEHDLKKQQTSNIAPDRPLPLQLTGKQRPVYAMKKRHRNRGQSAYNALVKVQRPEMAAENRRLPFEPKSAHRDRLLVMLAKEWGAKSPRERRKYERERDEHRAEQRLKKPSVERFIVWVSKSPELVPDSCPWGLADD